MKGRPDFIPREIFRQYIPAGQHNKHYCVDNVMPSSYIQRRKYLGRPLKAVEGRYRPIDVVAAAYAENLSVTPDKTLLEAKNYEKLKEEVVRLKAEKEKLEREMVAPDVNELSWVLTGSRMLSKQAILDAAQHYAGVVGVYFLVSAGEIVYVGQSINVYGRVATHKNTGKKEFDSWAYVPCEKAHLDIVESLYIHALQPEHNTSGASVYAPLSFERILKIAAKSPTDPELRAVG